MRRSWGLFGRPLNSYQTIRHVYRLSGSWFLQTCLWLRFFRFVWSLRDDTKTFFVPRHGEVGQSEEPQGQKDPLLHPSSSNGRGDSTFQAELHWMDARLRENCRVGLITRNISMLGGDVWRDPLLSVWFFRRASEREEKCSSPCGTHKHYENLYHEH